MSRVLKVNQSDYVLQVQNGGNIILNTGTSVGTVIVTGNLNVKGITTTVESTDTTIKDNIIRLNYGETGDGISGVLGYQAGIEIVRGSRDAAQLVFSEQVNHYDSVISTDKVGTFRLLTRDTNNSVALSGLQVRTIANDGTADLVFDLQSGSSVLKIANSTNYEARVTDDDHIPNKKYVSDYVSATGGTANVTNIHYPLVGLSFNSIVQAGATTVDVIVGGNLKTQFSAAGVAINNILISGDTITDTSLNNLILTATTNNVEVDAVLNINNQGSTPTAVSGTTKVWSTASEGPGRTGIYFANDTPNTDELVSKNRAVLLSILL